MARFQSFDIADRPADTPAFLDSLRERIALAGANGFLLPRADAFLGEWVAPPDERLAFLTGFTGSAGLLLVLAESAHLFVDGRYTVQAKAQVPAGIIEVEEFGPETLSNRVADRVPPNTVIGYDPWLHPAQFIDRLRERKVELRAITPNPVDSVWAERPERILEPVRPHPPELAGESAADKCARMVAELRETNLDAVFLASPESVCWLLNLRGNDVPHTPIVQTRAVLHADGGVDLFLGPSRLPKELAEAISRVARIEPPETLPQVIARLTGKRLGLEASTTPDHVVAQARANGVEVVEIADPTAKARACKNHAEIEGMRHAHRLDGAALVAFLAWFDSKSSEILAETDIVDELEMYRIATGELNDISFDTIAATGPHAALPHYRVDRTSNRALEEGEFLLLDSGGQYRTGTTDVTRTLPKGDVTPAMRTVYTRVLRAMIEVSMLRFPAGTTGAAVDAIARRPLWQAGHNYDHGTGHGVGSCLSVHEGPFRLSLPSAGSNLALVPGLILSNEPAAYFPGAYGVRIENLLLIKEAVKPRGGSRPMHEFETLTLAPVDTRPVDLSTLGAAATEWLNQYHDRVRRELQPLLGPAEREWLDRACHPIGTGDPQSR